MNTTVTTTMMMMMMMMMKKKIIDMFKFKKNCPDEASSQSWQ